MQSPNRNSNTGNQNRQSISTRQHKRNQQSLNAIEPNGDNAPDYPHTDSN